MNHHAKLPLGPPRDQLANFRQLDLGARCAFFRRWMVRLLELPRLIKALEDEGWTVELDERELLLYPPEPMSRKALRAMISELEANDYQTKQPHACEPFDPASARVGIPAPMGEDVPRLTKAVHV